MPPHSARGGGRPRQPPPRWGTATGLFGLGKYYRNLFGGSNILREFDTGCAVAPSAVQSPRPCHQLGRRTERPCG
jgi:hypothetical protein